MITGALLAANQRNGRFDVAVTFDERRGYVGRHPELRAPVTALSLGGLRRKVEAAFGQPHREGMGALSLSCRASQILFVISRTRLSSYYPIIGVNDFSGFCSSPSQRRIYP